MSGPCRECSFYACECPGPTARKAIVRAHEMDEMVRDAAPDLVQALLKCHQELSDQAGWSGSSGNWPLHEAVAAAEAALRKAGVVE